MSYSFPSFNGDLSILVKIECRTSDGTIISAIRPQTRWLWWHWKPNLQCALRFYGAKNSENTRHGFDGEIEDEGYDGTSQASEGTSCWHTRYPLHLTFQFISALSSSAHVIDTSTQLPFFLLFVLHPSFGVFSHCKQACYFFSCPFRPPEVTDVHLFYCISESYFPFVRSSFVRIWWYVRRPLDAATDEQLHCQHTARADSL